jgi:hypothetical protein
MAGLSGSNLDEGVKTAGKTRALPGEVPKGRQKKIPLR